MINLFEITDYSKRKIHLSIERWRHITREHPNLTNVEEIIQTLKAPLTLRESKYNPYNVKYYYSYIKSRKQYLLVAVKYLNGGGFVITAFYVSNLQ